MVKSQQVDADVYSEDYFRNRCGGVEFFDRYRYTVLKPQMQDAVQMAEIASGHRVLDVGCGRGELVAHLTEKGYQAEGIDYAKDAIDVARQNFPGGNYTCSNMYETPLAEKSFDRIFFLGTIEHLYEAEIQKTLPLLMQALKDNGRIVITTCTNRLYHKTLTYHVRKKAVLFLNKIGLHLSLPSPPRSDEDDTMHINEQNYFSLHRHLKPFSSHVRVYPRPNPKLRTGQLYGENLPANFPVRAAKPWKQAFHQKFLFWFPLNLLLARNYLVVLEKQHDNDTNAYHA